MRILLISNTFPPKIVRGYELRARDFARHLSRAGHRVVVASSAIFAAQPQNTEPFEIFRTFECVDFLPQVRSAEDRLHLGLFVNLDNLVALAALIGTVKPDAVFCFNLSGLGAFGMLHLLHALGHQPLWFVGDTLMAAKSRSAAIARFAAVLGTRAIVQKIFVVAEASAAPRELACDVGMPLSRAGFRGF
jgi:hypothetical protein